MLQLFQLYYFLVVWALIIIAYINYSRNNPELHKKATYKLPGGLYGICNINILHFCLRLIICKCRY